MIIAAKVREKSQLGTDLVVHPADTLWFPAVPTVGSVIEIPLSANETNYTAQNRPYLVIKRILEDVKDPRGECFDPYRWHFHLVAIAMGPEPIYEQLYLNCRFNFNGDVFERRRFGEYGAVTLVLNGVELEKIILADLPSHPNDVVHYREYFYAVERAIFRADRSVQVEIGNLLSYDEAYHQALENQTTII